MRVLTWNIQWGRGIDGRVDLPRIARYIAATGAEVVCLQEASDGMPDLPGCCGEDQFATLAALMPGHCALEGAGLVAFDAQGRRRRFGNMILSRLPVLQVRSHALPWLADGPRHLPRAALEALLMGPDGPLRVITTHLEYFSGAARAAQIEALAAVVAQGAARAATPPEAGEGPYAALPHTAATILTGDFNLRSDHPALSPLHDLFDCWRIANPHLPHPPSFCIADRTYGEPLCCDLIFVSEELRPLVRSVIYDVETRLSDHQPVLLTLGGPP